MWELPDEEVSHFWSSFPCPPPWRPQLLTEVNTTSKLPPNIRRQVQAFLAGKCRLQHVLAESLNANGLDLFPPGDDIGSRNEESLGRLGGRSQGAGLSANQVSSEIGRSQSFCEFRCQIVLTSALILALVILLGVIVIYVTRYHRKFKMAVLGTSREHLQMSSSFSDTETCTVFSNLEVLADDETLRSSFFHAQPPAGASPCCPTVCGSRNYSRILPNPTFDPIVHMDPSRGYCNLPHSIGCHAYGDDRNRNRRDMVQYCGERFLCRKDFLHQHSELDLAFYSVNQSCCSCSQFDCQSLSDNHLGCCSTSLSTLRTSPSGADATRFLRNRSFEPPKERATRLVSRRVHATQGRRRQAETGFNRSETVDILTPHRNNADDLLSPFRHSVARSNTDCQPIFLGLHFGNDMQVRGRREGYQEDQRCLSCCVCADSGGYRISRKELQSTIADHTHDFSPASAYCRQDAGLDTDSLRGTCPEHRY
ncbi:hypothetical protein PoB_003527500 [Plakobranchus ocellatus]|uniref:Uncharacterized protein n=1 Tax=Plakobranchus ocellatus TaxID=259542 RepID=A0AAV4AKT4_9GAST|nr:hypothetical protein PoB_003527500 [Plakobranchus ocellatus]